MFDLTLVGIGTGNPDHLTRAAIRALNDADLILIPRKGGSKADLADLRRAICADVVTNPTTQIVEFDLPVRDAGNPDYLSRVDDWHDDIAKCWISAIATAPGPSTRVALLVWGDPSLYDSTLRIAARLIPAPRVTVIPGITSMQALCAAHAIPLNDIGAPVLVTTGRKLRDEGWPVGVDTLVVMLDGDCAFQELDPDGVSIWWAGYVGMAEEILFSGPLTTVGPQIIAARTAARAAHGWIMDIYLLRRKLR
jgi:precorrin-6A synthase